MKKFNISSLFKFATPFSIVFCLSFVFIASLFNIHYNADIDLSFVNEIGVSLNQNTKKIVSQASNSVENIKSELYVFAEGISVEDKNETDTASKNLSSENTNPDKSIYDFTIKRNFLYMSQHDPRWKDMGFKEGDSLDIYGCGPTSVAMIVRAINGTDIDPYQVAQSMYEHGMYTPSAGSNHAIMTKGLAQYSIESTGFYDYSAQAMISELEKGNMFAVLTKKGLFSNSTGHFIVLVGLDENGNVLIADSNSLSNSKKSWDIKTILKELKYSAGSGGPVWLIRGLVSM